MFEDFSAAFSVDEAGGSPWEPPAELVPGFADVVRRWGGLSFRSGLYRVHTEASSASATEAIRPFLPARTADAVAFGFDWQGRVFAVSPSKWPAVLMVDFGGGEVFEIPGDLAHFHDVELVHHPDAALDHRLFADWRLAHRGAALPFDRCVGYQVPLFLGGPDDEANLEVVDTDVYWTVTAQVYARVTGR